MSRSRPAADRIMVVETWIDRSCGLNVDRTTVISQSGSCSFQCSSSINCGRGPKVTETETTTLAVKMLGRACRVSPHRLALPCTRSFVSKPTTDLSNCTITWDDYTSRLRLRRRGTLQWHREPKTVLLIKKWKDERVTKKAREVRLPQYALACHILPR